MLAKLAAAGHSPEELEKLAGIFERMGRGAKNLYERAQVGMGNLMTGAHGHGIEHALQKVPTASPSKMLMAYAGDPHVQKAVAGHVTRGARAVGRGAQQMGQRLQQAMRPAGPTPIPAFA